MVFLTSVAIEKTGKGRTRSHGHKDRSPVIKIKILRTLIPPHPHALMGLMEAHCLWEELLLGSWVPLFLT